MRAGDLTSEHVNLYATFIRHGRKWEGTISMVSHTRTKTRVRLGERDFPFQHDEELDVF